MRVRAGVHPRSPCVRVLGFVSALPGGRGWGAAAEALASPGSPALAEEVGSSSGGGVLAEWRLPAGRWAATPGVRESPTDGGAWLPAELKRRAWPAQIPGVCLCGVGRGG